MKRLTELFSLHKNKSPSAKTSEAVQPDTEKPDAIISYVREHCSKPVFRFSVEEKPFIGLTDSKLGGTPYWPLEKAYPKNSSGKPLILLAQINFENECFDSDLLPSKGLLQFFISSDDLYGMSFQDMTQQENFRVVYHEDIDSGISESMILKLGIITNTMLNQRSDSFPFFHSYALRFTKEFDVPGLNSTESEKAISEAFKTVSEEKFVSVWKSFRKEEYSYLAEHLNASGNKMLGYPEFTQEDPRWSPEESGKEPSVKEFDTLLLQIDSDFKDILWGDGGICHFFIQSEKLKQLDFSRILYNWDCH